MWGPFVHSLGIVQWNSTRRDHPGNPGGVSGSGPVNSNGEIRFVIRDPENKFLIFNRNYNFVTEITILPFFQKLEFLESYI